MTTELQSALQAISNIINIDIMPKLDDIHTVSLDPLVNQKLDDLKVNCLNLSDSINASLTILSDELDQKSSIGHTHLNDHTHSNKTFLDSLTSFKTINNQTLIGSGDISISSSIPIKLVTSDSSGAVSVDVDFGLLLPQIFKKQSLTLVGKCIISQFQKFGSYVAMDSIFFYDGYGSRYNFGSYALNSTDGNTSYFANGSVSVSSKYGAEYPCRCLLDENYVYSESYWLTSEASPKVTVLFSGGMTGLSKVSFVPRPGAYGDRGITSAFFDFYDLTGTVVIASFIVSISTFANNALYSQNMTITPDLTNYKLQNITTFEVQKDNLKTKITGLSPNTQYFIKG